MWNTRNSLWECSQLATPSFFKAFFFSFCYSRPILIDVFCLNSVAGLWRTSKLQTLPLAAASLVWLPESKTVFPFKYFQISCCCCWCFCTNDWQESVLIILISDISHNHRQARSTSGKRAISTEFEKRKGFWFWSSLSSMLGCRRRHWCCWPSAWSLATGKGALNNLEPGWSIVAGCQSCKYGMKSVIDDKKGKTHKQLLTSSSHKVIS